jgi:aerobic carbon-monoxide dehydrogenase medium subunit
MKPARFDYFAPRTLEEAIELLAEHEAEASVLAGGQSLVPAMNFRLATPGVLIDLNSIPSRNHMRVEGAELVIEMLVRHVDFERPALGDPLGGLLAQTSLLVGHLPIRTRGTFAGSLAHADPAAEWCMVALALDATIVVQSVRGERHIEASRFFQGLFTTALAPDEIITEVRLPLLRGAGTGICEQSQTAGDFATVAAVAIVRVEKGVIAEARLAVAGAETRPARPRDGEAALVGGPAEADVLQRAASIAAHGLEPTGDASCSADYRRHLAEVLTRRALEKAVERAA